MKTYRDLANTVIITNKKNRLLDYDDSLELVGTGRSAFVFRIKFSNKAIKIFFPDFTHVAKEESEIYHTLQNISYFPTVYESGKNYIVMDFIEGRTLYECINQGVSITTDHINEIDAALLTASNRGLNPSDIHLRNIIITPNQEIKLIDVARFRQTKDCTQWHDLKLAYHQLYLKRFFPKKIPTTMLNFMAFLYKKHLLPNYLSSSKAG